MLCGTKADLEDIREVDKFDAGEFAKRGPAGCNYHEVSNKCGEGVEEMFSELSFKIWEK